MHASHVLVYIGGVLGVVVAVVAAVSQAMLAVGLARKVVRADMSRQRLGRVEEPRAHGAAVPPDGCNRG